MELHRNQYALVERKGTDDEDVTRWSGFDLHVGPGTEVSVANGRLSVLLIGAVFRPRTPGATSQDIADDLSMLAGLMDVVSASDHLSGRYALFVAVDGNVYGIPDACSFKRIAYGVVDGRRVITSSERYALEMTEGSPRIEPAVAALLRDPAHLALQSRWFGFSSPDSRFTYLLPNHYLDATTFARRRVDLPRVPDLSNREKIAVAAEMLRGTIDAARERHPLRMGLTAGLDSRCLFAASLHVKDDIEYFVFADEGEDRSVPELAVPTQIARDYDLNFSVVTRPPVPEDFRQMLARQTLIERDVPKYVSNIYHHYLTSKPGTLVINGNAAEIFRCSYGMQLTPFVKTRSLVVLGRVRRFPLLVEGIDEWRSEAEPFASANAIPIIDLFYWEQRMALWGSEYPLEQDVALDQISPFNSRYLLSLLTSLPTRWRMAPRNQVSRALISHFDPGLLRYPVNSLSHWETRPFLIELANAVVEVRVLRRGLAQRFAKS